MRVVSRDLLAHADDDELEWYVSALASATDLDGLSDDGPWALQARQQVAEDACVDLDPEMSHELLYGGAAGPGKSEWLLWHLFHLAVKYPKFRGLLLRRTFPELRRSAILRSLERFDRDQAHYVITESTWKFRNGSFIEFGYCEHDNDVYQYQSAEYDCVAWDELTQWSSDYPYLYLFSRCRSRRSMLARGYVPHVIAASNPGGVGGGWVKGRFVDVAEPEVRSTHTNVLPGGRGVTFGDRIFIPGKLSDNRYIDEASYVANLANLGDDLMLALLEGSWDVIEGQFFPEWNRSVHVVAPFEVPRWWSRAGGVDYGYAKPFCSLDAAFDADGTCYIYREHYATEHTPKMQAERIKAAYGPGEKVAYRVGDPSMWSRTGVGVPIAQQYAENGVNLRRALNDRKSGWARVREYLRITEGADGVGRPGVVVFSNCVNLIRTLPMLVRDGHNPEDCDTDGEDHAPDALRYLLMTRPARSHPPKVQDNTLEGRLARQRRERERERVGRGGIDHPQLGRI